MTVELTNRAVSGQLGTGKEQRRSLLDLSTMKYLVLGRHQLISTTILGALAAQNVNQTVHVNPPHAGAQALAQTARHQMRAPCPGECQGYLASGPPDLHPSL